MIHVSNRRMQVISYRLSHCLDFYRGEPGFTIQLSDAVHFEILSNFRSIRKMFPDGFRTAPPIADCGKDDIVEGKGGILLLQIPSENVADSWKMSLVAIFSVIAQIVLCEMISQLCFSFLTSGPSNTWFPRLRSAKKVML